ncbi:hypothetical protein DPMN_076712 [Dreissena polymorpha]|uniref:Uncharacterized protein n=1 Tax=Dreissena polymorpha TaxID=45954 RepID=A0A9D4BMM6_DREPO|nr:hypothetical protein DPMN_076712 [Dreissena polymorpha]
MWTDGQRTKTNPKTSPEQSAIFQLVQEINKTSAKNVTSIVKTAPPPWQPFPICKPIRDIYKTNLFTKFHYAWAKYVTSRETSDLTKFHENWAKIETSRVLTCFHYLHIQKNAPPTGGHVFSPIWTIFELVREINKTNVLPTVMMIGQKLKTTPPTGGHVFQRTGTTVELNQDIIKTNILTNFELDRDFIRTKLLTKFHEEWTINVASRMFTNKC